ncbi:MAG TPA: PH domain-containing protein [Jatrophihabitans sp.]
MTTPADPLPLLWRISPALAAALYVIAAALLAVAIYLRPPFAITLGVAGLGIAAAAAATYTARQLLYADRDGIVLRRLFNSRSLSWSEIEAIAVVQRGRTGMTLAIDLVEGPSVMVPPSLVLPSTPHNIASTRNLLKSKARQLGAIGGLRDD